MVNVVLTPEVGREACNSDSLRLVFVSLRFLDFAYQAGMHFLYLHLLCACYSTTATPLRMGNQGPLNTNTGASAILATGVLGSYVGQAAHAVRCPENYSLQALDLPFRRLLKKIIYPAGGRVNLYGENWFNLCGIRDLRLVPQARNFQHCLPCAIIAPVSIL